jgi:hypothetical protein
MPAKGASMKRFSILIALLCASTFAAAQKADAAFVVGGSFVSDTKETFSVSPTPFDTIKTDHHLFLEGALGVRLLNAHVASLSLDVPVAGIPSQKVTFASAPGTVIQNLSTLFITPGLRLKLLPVSPISPWVTLGGGWARYSQSGFNTNKAAIEYGGGLDFKTGLPLLGFRAEVRDFVTGDFLNGSIGSVIAQNSSGLHHHNILAGGGIVLRF